MNDKEFIKMYAAVILYTLGIIGITIAACYMWHSMHLAIKLHNPKAGYKYHKDIEDKYNELINN